jgi:hypothetical protein
MAVISTSVIVGVSNGVGGVVGSAVNVEVEAIAIAVSVTVSWSVVVAETAVYVTSEIF